MLTEYHGEPVAGGTFPAEIWHAFTQTALAGTPPESFPSYSLPYASLKRVAWRDGRLQIDNGYCRDTVELAYFAGMGPRRTANCHQNEVDIPRVVGEPLAKARERLAAQPLKANVVYKPAKPKQPTNVVLDQFPRSGRVSSFSTVTLVLAKPLNGLVPRVVGLPLARARVRLKSAGLDAAAPDAADDHALVIRQSPRAGVAAAPHMRVILTVRAARG